MDEGRKKAIDFSSDELLEHMQAPLEERRRKLREEEMARLAKEEENSNLKFIDQVLEEKKHNIVEDDEEFDTDEEFMEYTLKEKRNRR